MVTKYQFCEEKFQFVDSKLGVPVNLIFHYLSCWSSGIDIKAGIINQISLDAHRDDLLFFLEIPFNFQALSSSSYFPDKMTRTMSISRELFYERILQERIGFRYVIDVLWGQPIKLIQVDSTVGFHDYWWNNIVFLIFCPLHFVQGLRSKNVK